MNDTTMLHRPAVGDKVYVRPIGGNWLAIEEYYRTVPGTVTSVSVYESGTLMINAEFTSRTKPDDTVSFGFQNYSDVCEPGDVVYAYEIPLFDHLQGETVTIAGVEKDTHSGIVYYRAKFSEGMSLNFHKAIKVKDGSTLTVSDPYRPAVGERVWLTGYLTDDGIVDGVQYPATVQSMDGDLWIVHTAALGHVATGPGYVDDADPENNPRTLEEVMDAPEAAKAEPVPADLHHSQIERLERELERANERVEQLSRRSGKWERDFNRYSARILQEAIDRGWCEEYERVVDDIRGDLEIGEIPDREQEYEVEVEITASVSYTTSVTVTARSQDEAFEIVSENTDDYVSDPEQYVIDNIRYAHVSVSDVEVQ